MLNKSTQIKRDRRIFSPEDKRKLYQQWKSSGLNKHQFCQKYDLVLSAFGKWCRKVTSEEQSSVQNDWIPVVVETTGSKKESIVVEIKIPQVSKIYIALLILILFLSEVLHAIAVVR